MCVLKVFFGLKIYICGLKIYLWTINIFVDFKIYICGPKKYILCIKIICCLKQICVV